MKIILKIPTNPKQPRKPLVAFGGTHSERRHYGMFFPKATNTKTSNFKKSKLKSRRAPRLYYAPWTEKMARQKGRPRWNPTQCSHGIKHPSQSRNERRHEDMEASGEHKCPLKHQLFGNVAEGEIEKKIGTAWKKNIDGKRCIGQDFQNCAKDIPTLWPDNSSKKKRPGFFLQAVGKQARLPVAVTVS